jgi:hypothetical protein
MVAKTASFVEPMFHSWEKTGAFTGEDTGKKAAVL